MRLLEPILPDRLRSTRSLRAFGLVFLVAQLALGLLVDRRQDLRFPWPGALAARIREAGRAPDVLLLGSSRTMRLFETPERPDRPPAGPGPWILNASMPTCAGPCMEIVLGAVLRAAPRPPALVVVEVSPETVGRAMPWLKLEYLRTVTWREVPATLPDLDRSQALMAFVSTRFDPAYRQREVVWRLGVEALGGDPHASDRFDPVGPPGPLTPSEGTMRTAPGFRKWLRRYQTGGFAADALRRTLATCRERGIPTVLLSTPLARLHRDLYTPEIEAAFQAFLHELTAAYGSPVVDWRARYPDTALTDSHHLGPEGGRQVSNDLLRLVLEPALAARRDG